jgi:serine/threonine-protein kinase
LIGSVLAGRFEVNAVVAEGPIFTLLRARDRITGRDASLRLVRSPFDGQNEFIEALGRAVKKVSPISHPNVERLIELDRHEGQVYIVGEWTQAPVLSDRIRKLAPFSTPVAVAAALSVCRGLDAFHKLGIVHGDVGPDTACLMADGEVRLQMGGLWEAYSASPTAGAMVLPTLAPALAPEVGKGAMPSLQSDVYGVGILLYELLTGRKPYIGDTPLATAMRHGTDPTPRVRDLNPSVPMVLDEIIAKAMSKNPSARYASAGEMAADLRLVQDALRFGRTLTWPLRPGVSAAPAARAVAPSRAPKAATPGRVAPKMSAIQDDDDEDFGKPERDVPAWASIGLALVACVAVSLLAVYFVLNLNRPRLVTVPSVRNFSVAEARTAFERYKLTMRVDANKVPDDKVEADHVIGTEPPDRTRVREGTTIVATVSAGPAQATVPDLAGLTPDSARSQLEKLGLVLDSDYEKANKPPAKSGTIVAQDPPAKAKVARDARIHVTVQDDSLPPPQLQRYDYTLGVNLAELQQRARVRIEIEDVDGKREVSNERRSPGDQFTVKARARGEQATFRIYYDDRLVKTITQRSDGQNNEVTP